MIQLTVDGKRYGLPQDWPEVTLEQCAGAATIAQEYKDSEEGKKKAVSEDQYDEYRRKYVASFLGIPDEASRAIIIKDVHDQLGLRSIFEYLMKFTEPPADEDIEPIQEFNFVGRDYHCHPTVDGMLMAEETFDAYMTANHLRGMAENLQEGDFKHVAQFIATIYRPLVTESKWFGLVKSTHVERFDQAKMKIRAEIFAKLPMSIVWSASFFLRQLKDTFTKRTTSYLEEGTQALSGGQAR